MAKLVGEAPSFVNAIKQIPQISRSDAAVLISGETGTGKELVARAIHYTSARAPFPFIPVNCGSLPDTLLEDELFGHERGAFTDARARRPGLIEQASQGTLFLDEVDSLSLKAQVALLRVLQDKKYRAIGSSGERLADVRIVSATNAKLEELVEAGGFRADLFYRLCVFTINLPPLRARKEDIIQLASHFLGKHTPAGQAPMSLSPAACAALIGYNWPGNVRELENAIIRGIHLCQPNPTGSITREDLGLRPSGAPVADEPATCARASFKELKQALIAAFEQDYLAQLMREYQGNVSRAARSAGKERREFGKLLKKYGLDPAHFRQSNLVVTSGSHPLDNHTHAFFPLR